MPETPTGPEQPRQQPISAGAGPDRPGYPPPGYGETMAALAAAEADAHPGDADAALAGDLAALDGDIESPVERSTRLAGFVSEHFADTVSAEFLMPAVAVCCNYEDQCRELFGEPDLLLGEEDAADPLLQEMVENAVLAAENDDTIVALTDDERTESAMLERQETDLVPASQAERASVGAAHPEVTVPSTETGRAAALADAEAQTDVLRDRDATVRVAVQDEHDDEAEMAEGVSTARELQARFDELKAQHGTVGALELLLEGEYSIQNVEMRAIVQRTIGTVRSLVTSLPGREDVVTRLLDGANLNLGATTNAGAFADFLTAVDASDDLSEAEKQTLREVIGAESAPPTNASELQSALREGRGTERVQVGTETVEEPPGSGNWVERPVFEERIIPFDETEPLVLSASNPRVVAYPDPPGSDTYRFVGEVEGTAPVSIHRLIPASGAFPAASINNDMNEMLLDTVLRSNNLGGGLQGLLGLSDGTLGVTTDIDSNAPGRVEVTQAFLSMCLGENTTLNNRFLTGSELSALQHEIRHLVPDGDFGAFNRVDPTTATNMMQALFGSDVAQMRENMSRARPFINTGGAEQPSYQRLYALMYPEDAANGYARLRGIIGDDGLASLNFTSDQPA